MENTKKNSIGIYLLVPLLAAVILSGCQTGASPRLRVSDYFGSPGGLRFPDPNDLGPHCLDACPGEKLGLVYACKAGFIDLGHLREAADRTHYTAQTLYQNILRSETTCSFRIIEPSQYHLRIWYPENWRKLPLQTRRTIAREVSLEYGQYIAHTSLIWHEIVTWYGFSSAGIFPENISAFSWEDPYSDVLGTHLGAAALSDGNGPYEENMAKLIDKTLRQLDVQPAEIAKEAAKKVYGQWYEGGYYFFVKMKKRNFDVGLDDGVVMPWLVPGICPDAAPLGCPRPNPGCVLDTYGFRMRLEIAPMVFEKHKIYDAIGLEHSERVKPHIHFPMIIDCIREDAERLDGPDIDTCPQ